MNRRRFLHAATLAGSALVAGCFGDGDESTETPAATPGGTDRAGTSTTTPASTAPTAPTAPTATASPAPDGPSGVYVQSFRETMAAPGQTTAGDYRVALLLTVPHRFWTVAGGDRSAVPIEAADDVHLMAAVWDAETGTVLPDSGLSVEITRDGDLVSEEVIYPMLSQRMGFHYGANFSLSGDGTYAANLSVGGVGAERTGSFAGRFGESATAAVEFEWSQAVRDQLVTRPVDAAGERGALRPMEMADVPAARAPEPSALPGTVLGTGRSDDAKLVATQLDADAAGRFTDGDPYLAGSARTPYNRLVLPSMALGATATRDGDAILGGDPEADAPGVDSDEDSEDDSGGDAARERAELARTLDPELGYHYGVALPDRLASGDELTIAVGSPPSLARHEGYERAFLQMDPVTVTV